MSQKEAKRAQILELLKEGKLSQQAAAKQMGISFTHPLNSHQPYRFLCFPIKFASIFFHARSDHNLNPKVPRVSPYLLTHE